MAETVPAVETSNAALIHRYFDEVWNRGRIELLDEIIDPDYLNHSPGIPDPRPGPQDLKPIVLAMRDAIEDLRYEILDLVASRDKVAVHVRMTGTHTGSLFGVPPRGGRVDVRQMQIEWIRGGRIWQHWRLTDEATLMRQIS